MSETPSESERRKDIVFPSGENAGSSSPAESTGGCVKARQEPVAVSRISIRRAPPAAGPDRAISWLEGDQAIFPASRLPQSAIRCAGPPIDGTLKISQLSFVRRTNAILCPSADQAGSAAEP